MLSAAQKDAFNRDGYLIINDVIDTALLDRIKAEYAARMNDIYTAWFGAGRVSAPPETLDFWQQLAAARAAGLEWYQPRDISLPHADITDDTPFHFGPSVFDLLTNTRVLDIAESVIGSELTSNPIQHVRIKPPQAEVDPDEVRAHIVATAWHQDRGVGLAEADETEILTVWIAMTDATSENGCLRVIPTPPDRMLPHCPKAQTAIADAFVEEDRAIDADHNQSNPLNL